MKGIGPNFILVGYASLVFGGCVVPPWIRDLQFAQERCSLVPSATVQPLTDSLGISHFLDQPLVARIAEKELWLGTYAMAWPNSPNAPAIRGVLKRKDGSIEIVERTVGHIYKQLPRLMFSDGRRVHVVWGVGSDTTECGLMGNLQSIQYSIYDGTSWTPPETVMRGNALYWGPAQPATLVANGKMFVATINQPGSSISDVTRLWISRRENGVWKQAVVAESDVVMAMHAVRLESNGRNSLVAAYSGFVKLDDRNYESAVWIVQSSDNGASWNKPQLIRHLPPGATPMLGGLHRLSDGSLHVF